MTNGKYHILMKEEIKIIKKFFTLKVTPVIIFMNILNILKLKRAKMIIKKIDFADVREDLDIGVIIRQIINIDNNSMVVVIKPDSKIFNNDELETLRNVFLVDKEGNVIWRVTSKDDDTPYFGYFLSANYKDNVLTAYRWGGVFMRHRHKNRRCNKICFYEID
jgi:hypothetical protein